MAKSVKLSPAEITAKWQKRLTQAIPDIQAGINRVNENPMQKAAAQADKWHQKVLESKEKWQNSMNKISLEDWKRKTSQKVGQRMSGGVQEAQAKHQAFAKYLVDTLNSVLPEIHNMPKLTLEDSKARVTAYMDKMAARPYKK